jgi:hypothetical protein
MQCVNMFFSISHTTINNTIGYHSLQLAFVSKTKKDLLPHVQTHVPIVTVQKTIQLSAYCFSIHELGVSELPM